MTVKTTIHVRGGVLVAHDGSPSSSAALATAARCAPAFGGAVEVVRAWSITTAPTPASSRPGFVPPLQDFEAATLAALEADVASVRAEHPDVVISTSVVHGHPADEIVKASGDVDLVVVGSRGRGGFIGLLLGSVSSQVVQHARCSVLVDRGHSPAGHERRSVVDEPRADALASELKLD